MKYRIKIITKNSNVKYIPQWKRYWISFWDNEDFVIDGYFDVIDAYNDIKKWQSQEELFSNKLKPFRFFYVKK
jgi:hypothetical protein